MAWFDEDKGLNVARMGHGQFRNEQFMAHLDGARNLVVKALRARRARDEDRATQLLERACQFGWDDREGRSVGPFAAHMLLFTTICEECEESDQDDSLWLDAALAAHATLAGLAQEELAASLRSFVFRSLRDEDEITPAERRHTLEVLGEGPWDVDDGLTADSSVDDQVAVMRATLEAIEAYDRGLMMAAAAETSPL